MKKALISPNEPRTYFDGATGVRVCQVTEQVFDVAPPFFWVDCEDYVEADDYYWDGNQILPVPVPPVPPAPEPTPE